MICFFFFNDTATTEIYTLSLHDALPISRCRSGTARRRRGDQRRDRFQRRDRKSTRLNSSHSQISYAVFCLKKKKQGVPTKTKDKAVAQTAEAESTGAQNIASLSA